MRFSALTGRRSNPVAASSKKKLPARTVPVIPALGPEARRFIEGEPAAEPKRSEEPPKLSTSQTPKRSSAQKVPTRAVIERADGRRLRKTQIYFNEATATRLRLHCAREDVDMSAYVEALVEKDLNRLGG
jgi:hypothetical protein